MRVVVISDCEPQDRVIVDAVARGARLLQIVRPVPERRRGFRGLLSGAVPRLAERRLRRSVERHLARSGRGDLIAEGESPTLDIAADAINGEAMARHLRSLEPDLLLVSGGPILRPSIFRIPRAAINVHWGIAPAYRGAHTLFWPLLRGDWEQIGVTLHHIEPAVDGGHLLARIYPELSPADDEATLLAKCSRLAGEVVVELLEAMERWAPTVPTGQPQPATPGVMIRGNDRTLAREVEHRASRWLFRARPPVSEARVERFF